MNGKLEVRMTAVRDIGRGEQLFVAYDAYCLEDGWRERGRRLSKWLVGGCGCARCEREMKAEGEKGLVEEEVWSDVGAWDDRDAEGLLPFGRRIS